MFAARRARAQFLSSRDIQLGRGEPVSDTARVLSRYVNGIMARTFAHQTVLDLAEYATIPVINGLTDLLHPCQALTDYFTMSEQFGKPAGLKLAYVGDGNNMAHSLDVRRAEVRRGRRHRDAEGLRAERGRRREREGRRRGRRHEDPRDERPGRKRSPARTSSTRTCGRPWGRKPSRRSA